MATIAFQNYQDDEGIIEDKKLSVVQEQFTEGLKTMNDLELKVLSTVPPTTTVMPTTTIPPKTTASTIPPTTSVPPTTTKSTVPPTTITSTVSQQTTRLSSFKNNFVNNLSKNEKEFTSTLSFRNYQDDENVIVDKKLSVVVEKFTEGWKRMNHFEFENEMIFAKEELKKDFFHELESQSKNLNSSKLLIKYFVGVLEKMTDLHFETIHSLKSMHKNISKSLNKFENFEKGEKLESTVSSCECENIFDLIFDLVNSNSTKTSTTFENISKIAKSLGLNSVVVAILAIILYFFDQRCGSAIRKKSNVSAKGWMKVNFEIKQHSFLNPKYF